VVAEDAGAPERSESLPRARRCLQRGETEFMAEVAKATGQMFYIAAEPEGEVRTFYPDGKVETVDVLRPRAALH
jgi:hypothetical protein